MPDGGLMCSRGQLDAPSNSPYGQVPIFRRIRRYRSEAVTKTGEKNDA